MGTKIKKIGIALLTFCFLSLSCAYGAQLNKVAAVVNGQVITMFDLQKEAMPDLVRARINPNDIGKSEAADKILRNTLEVMIMDILVAQEAKRLKATVTPRDIDNEINRIMKERGLTQKKFEEQLAQQNLTLDALRKNMEKNMLRQKVMTMEVGRRVIVTPEEIKKYYEEHKESMYNRQGLHMGLLVYHPNANAAAISSQIKSGKMSFAEACAKYSIAPNKDKSGDTGPIQWDRLNTEWDKRLNGMKPGDVTELFPLQKFKAQVYVFRPGGGQERIMTLEEATPQIDAVLRQPKARERFDDYKNQLRKKAVIDIRF